MSLKLNNLFLLLILLSSIDLFADDKKNNDKIKVETVTVSDEVERIYTKVLNCKSLGYHKVTKQYGASVKTFYCAKIETYQAKKTSNMSYSWWSVNVNKIVGTSTFSYKKGDDIEYFYADTQEEANRECEYFIEIIEKDIHYSNEPVPCDEEVKKSKE